MKNFSHSFQRLPSEHELDPYQTRQPYTTYQGYADQGFDPAPAFNNPPRNQHEPVQVLSSSATPSKILSSPTFKVLGFLSHLILTLIPIAFIVLAFLAVSVDGEPISHRGGIVYQAAKLGPSIFPIVFAAVVGRLMKTFALWRAERGSTIGLLEQLNGSQNLLAAVERSFLVSSLWGWSLAIIVLWALSPLGGQSSLRILELAQEGSDFNQQVKYLNSDNYNTSVFLGASSLGYGLPIVQAIYQACLLAPASISSSSADVWGNVKIPLIQAQPGYTGSSTQDWIEVEHHNDTIYSSLIGTIVSGLRPDTTANFTIETSYLNLTCPAPVTFSSKNASSLDYINNFRSWMGSVAVHVNTSRNPFDHAFGNSEWNSFTVDTNYNYTLVPPSARTSNPINLIYAARNVDNYVITAYNCSVGSSRVESSVACNGTMCRVTRMRPSRQSAEPSISTPWNREDSYSYVMNFISTFPWLTPVVHSGETSPPDFYVAGSNLPYVSNVRSTDYSQVSGVQVAQRLGALVNTAWQSGITRSAIASPPPDPAVLQIPATPNQAFSARVATAVMQTTQTVYHASKLWVGFTAAISFVLFACGVAGMVFRYLTKVPDILGYVSTMTRDNPFFNDQRAAGADTLDGLERARLLRDVVVQISDVKPWQGNGHIALKRVSTGENRRLNRVRRGDRAPSPLASPLAAVR